MKLENEIHQVKEQVPFARFDRTLSIIRKKLILKDFTCVLKIKDNMFALSYNSNIINNDNNNNESI